MGGNLIEQLRQVKDFRTKDGQRHQLWLVLLFVIMGTMSGYVGYRAWGDFVKRHRRVLIDKFGIQKHGVPSYSTIRRILMGVDFDNLGKTFNQWAQQYVSLDTSEWVGVDGKSIKGTVKNYESEYQNFVSIVSVFAQNRGLVLGLDKLENKKGSEITTVQNLIATLDIEGVVFSLDALHCQKKLAFLIIDSGNDYALSEAMPLGLSQLKQIKKTCIAKFDIIQTIPSQQVAISQPKKLVTESQHVL